MKLVKAEELDRSSLGEVASKTLHAELRGLVELSARAMSSAASIYAELQARGEDLSYLNSTTVRILQLVADRVLTPEAGIAFGASKTLTQVVRELPPADQTRLASGPPVRVVREGTDGKEVVEVLGADMSISELQRIVDDGRILTVSEQRRRLEERKAAEPSERSITTRISAEDFLTVQKLADAAGLSISEFARKAIESAARRDAK